MRHLFFLLIFLAACLHCQQFETKYGIDDLSKVPAAPAYADLKYWVAHPEVADYADVVPGRGELQENQKEAKVDVFFVYPTIYSGKQNPDYPWFADLNDQKLNKDIETSTIKYQATVFNGSAKVYSPYYRQAHIGVFFSDSTINVTALDFAYQDVKNAFQHYLDNWNNGRPIIIASHSQGTVHAARLLHDFFEGKELMNQLVAAYIVGMPVQKDEFASILICDSPEETGCWMTWNTFLIDYYPPRHKKLYSNAASVNPLSWTTSTVWSPWDENKGGILKNFKKIRPELTDARNHEGMLWIHKPQFFWNFLFGWKRYHVVDYNLFYVNIRENVKQRVNSYFERNN